MSRQLAKRGEACLVRRLPRPRARWLAGRGEAYYCTTVRLYARSLTHARGGSQHEEQNLLLPPFTPRPYYVLWLVLPLFTYKRPL